MPTDQSGHCGDASEESSRVLRVAVIVVHGVADQRPGETAKSFVDLMVASKPGGASYVAGEHKDFTLHVPVLSPDLPFNFGAAARPATADATPLGRDRGFCKSLKQSVKSDFQSESSGTKPQQAASLQETSGTARASRPEAADRGLAFTRYLLSKAGRNGSPAEQYQSQTTRLTRRADGSELKIDVFEMFWADQSRLAGAIPRIVTEFFTMLFRLSRLGRDTVDEASRYVGRNRQESHRAWTLLSRLQTLIDWAFVNVLAQLFGQLLLVGLFLVAADLAMSALLLKTVGWVLIALSVLVAAYFSPSGRVWGLALLVLGLGAFVISSRWGLGVALLVVVTIVYSAGLRAADDRFPFTYLSGITIWSGLICATVIHQIWGPDNVAMVPSDALVQIGLTAFEFVLGAIKWWWIIMAVPLAVWAVLSMGLTFFAWRSNDYQRRGSVATGRLGALLSLASFLLVAMALWAALGLALQYSLNAHSYSPALWTNETITKIDKKTVCVDLEKKNDYPRNAAAFAECRFQASTSTFSLIVLLLLLVSSYLLVLTAPSVLAELQWASSDKQVEARRLGRWLTWFYRYLDRFVLLVTGAGVIVAVLVGYALGFPSSGLAEVWSRNGGDLSVQWLHWLFIPAAGTFALFSAFGGVLSRFVPGIRAPLDVALDVDNYMREFPRRAIPRARIFARYAALLAEVETGRYDRIVVVAHSQGTVISAEFLRYISSVTTGRGQEGRVQQLQHLLSCGSIRLLTLGCPLRQLYAARFPTLYEWILDAERKPNGPTADDVGVEVWANAFGSGDYVGRWLWSKHLATGRRYHPLYDGVGLSVPPGRVQAYDLFHPMPPSFKVLQPLREYETCIGFAAHTHYFDPPRKSSAVSVVALLADQLIAGPPYRPRRTR